MDSAAPRDASIYADNNDGGPWDADTLHALRMAAHELRIDDVQSILRDAFRDAFDAAAKATDARAARLIRDDLDVFHLGILRDYKRLLSRDHSACQASRSRLCTFMAHSEVYAATMQQLGRLDHGLHAIMQAASARDKSATAAAGGAEDHTRVARRHE